MRESCCKRAMHLEQRRSWRLWRRSDTDTPFLETYTEALTRTGKLDEARSDKLERMTDSQWQLAPAKSISRSSRMNICAPDGMKMRLRSSENTKKSMLAARRDFEFASAVDAFVEVYPKSIRLAEFRCNLYAELNRESKYFDALALLFDLYLTNNQVAGACESFEKARGHRSLRLPEPGAHGPPAGPRGTRTFWIE